MPSTCALQQCSTQHHQLLPCTRSTLWPSQSSSMALHMRAATSASSARAAAPDQLRRVRAAASATSSPAQAAAQAAAAAAAASQQLITAAGHHRASEFLASKLLASTAHTFTGATAARLQGVQVPADNPQHAALQVSVQWDSLQTLHDQLTREQPGPIQQQGRGQLGFSVQLQETLVVVSANLNTVVSMDPNRVAVRLRSSMVCWCESLLSVRQQAPSGDLAAAVSTRLQELQEQLTASNAQAWSQAEAEAAWVAKLGPPEATAQKIRRDPWLRLGPPLFKHLPEQLSGLKFINLLGSHGTRAVAAAVLGAQATCVDISPVNAGYCAQVAKAAGVEVQFVVADVLRLPPKLLDGSFDLVLLECGVLHYFLDLQPLFAVVRQLLKPGSGRFVLREFHPVSTKLITSKGKRHTVTGNYFSQQLVGSSVAWDKYSASGSGSERQERQVQLRQWGLGEVVSAAVASGLVVEALEEEPGVKADDAGLPKLFTLVCSARV